MHPRDHCASSPVFIDTEGVVDNRHSAKRFLADCSTMKTRKERPTESFSSRCMTNEQPFNRADEGVVLDAD